MNFFKLRSFGVLCTLSLCLPLLAVTNDTGPLGTKATGAPTPDAATLSKMQLLSDPAPLSRNPRVSDKTLSPSQRHAKFHPIWQQSHALRGQIATLSKLGKLGPQETSEAQNDLSGILSKYRLRKESDGMKMRPADQQLLKADLDALAARLSAVQAKP